MCLSTVFDTKFNEVNFNTTLLHLDYILILRYYLLASSKKIKKGSIFVAGSKKTLNPLTDTPANKVEVTKPFMLAFMKSEKATAEDKKWFKAIVSNPENQKEYINRLTNEPYIDIDIPKVRRAFCERFYPQLVSKKNKNKSFIDSVLDL